MTLAHLTITRGRYHLVHVTGGPEGPSAGARLYDLELVDPEEQAVKPRHRQRWESALYMDGPSLINFTVAAVPKLVSNILAAANLPVVFEYAGAPGAAIYLAAMCGCAGIAAIGWPRARARLWLALALLLAIAAAQLLLLRYVAPLYDANMDRDDALVLWWQRLAHGAYPYAGPTSGGHRISILSSAGKFARPSCSPDPFSPDAARLRSRHRVAT